VVVESEKEEVWWTVVEVQVVGSCDGGGDGGRWPKS